MANKNSQPAPGRGHQPLQLSPDVMQRLLDQQGRELEIRAEQLAIDAQREANQATIAKISIDANLKDRQDHRSYLERRTKNLFIGSTVLFSILCAFCGYVIYIGRGEIVYKIAEIISIFFAGFAGGYGLKAAKASRSESQD